MGLSFYRVVAATCDNKNKAPGCWEELYVRTDDTDEGMEEAKKTFEAAGWKFEVDEFMSYGKGTCPFCDHGLTQEEYEKRQREKVQPIKRVK